MNTPEISVVNKSPSFPNTHRHNQYNSVQCTLRYRHSYYSHRTHCCSKWFCLEQVHTLPVLWRERETKTLHTMVCGLWTYNISITQTSTHSSRSIDHCIQMNKNSIHHNKYRCSYSVLHLRGWGVTQHMKVYSYTPLLIE